MNARNQISTGSGHNQPVSSQTHCAVFRVYSRTVRDSAPLDQEEPEEGVVQERLLIPLNAVMGRHQLGQSSSGLCLRGPGVGRECFYEKQLDYFDRECSKRHCIIELDDEGEPRIRDFSSTNGTWVWRSTSSTSSRAGTWERLSVGLSCALKVGQRVQLGHRSNYEYEFLGLVAGAHVRIRYCSKTHDDIIHEHDWEWIMLPCDGSSWSSRELTNAQGETMHQGPHLRVRVEPGPLSGYLAHVEYEDTQLKSKGGYTQSSGSQVYGAELIEHEEYGDSELYQVGYELLLPGRGGQNTALNRDTAIDNRQLFLRSRYLRLHAELDEEGWASRARLDFADFLTAGPYSTELTFNAVRSGGTASPRFEPGELAPEQYYSAHAKSLRHAIVCALIQKRLEDQRKRVQDAGWISQFEVIGLTEFKEISGKEFRNNASKWRNDIGKLLRANATELQRSLHQIVAIPEEQEWTSFVEFRGSKEALSLRLHPGIWVEAK